MQYILCLLVCTVTWFLRYLGFFFPTHLAPTNAERGCWWRPQENLDCDEPGMLKVQFWIMFLQFYCSSVHPLIFFPEFPLTDAVLAMIKRAWLRCGYRLLSGGVAAPVCRWPTQVPFTCQSNPLGQGTPLPRDPSVLVLENNTFNTSVAMTLGRAAQWPCVLLPNSLGMADNIICPPGVLVGGYGEDIKNNFSKTITIYCRLCMWALSYLAGKSGGINSTVVSCSTQLWQDRIYTCAM